MEELFRSFHLDESTINWDKSRYKQAWRIMNLIRAFEEKSIQIYKKGLMGGSLHSSIGQEAVAAGVCMNLNKDDYISITYRGRGQALAKGADPFRLFSEILGKKTGYCKGKGGPMHIASQEIGILVANGIVGAGIPIAVGAGLSIKTLKKNQVSVAFFGDGATNQGAFHEALNLAAVLKLPIIFICENNLYSEMTPIKNAVLNEHLAERGLAYRIPSIVVDGNDVRAVYEVAKQAVNRAREGGGPTLIEAETYRLVGHMIGDAETYRSREEVEEWRLKEPITYYRDICLKRNVLNQRELDEIQQQVKKEIEIAYERAMKSEEPEMEEIFHDVY
ncbi:thiamine pyrophosphate-dependent dehydrogenase E1 component subunit alpha [Bacillus smithii]|uniref:thiamine pyrophosphate-dependent dehydrogenase E1 component subunit alpha n=1 Tax=Bacillus smithii TaxID=1479 RepID=UPI003D1A20E3